MLLIARDFPLENPGRNNQASEEWMQVPLIVELLVDRRSYQSRPGNPSLLHKRHDRSKSNLNNSQKSHLCLIDSLI